MDYKKLSFKSGLEIHAQIDSHKLFCNCPSILRQDPPDGSIRRELRPLAGETGEIDIAALYERKKYKKYIYEYYSDTNCELEIDECPPYPINQEALTVALTVAKLLHCNFPDTIQVMRKTVIDGSNTSGFQRTVLVGMDGWLETTFGKVGINYLILEEDAGRRVAEDKKSVTYRLDRLGIPMLEIVTAPDMKTPEQVVEVARKIGLLVRATGKAMRGIGTVRQDVNVSIKGHCRVEMKGVQDLRLMQKYIDTEIKRQQTSKDEVPHVRNVKPDFTSKYLRPLPGAARMYPETDIPLIHVTKERLAKLKLPETHEEKLSKFKKLGLSDNLAKQLVTH
ncbi:MAG: Glu-tRNA(Gln) amidotransferase subunit GatE, partial [Candidatus Woesearchaeota archaeon]